MQAYIKPKTCGSLTICIQENPKRVLLQTVKTLSVKVKKIFRQNITTFFLYYNLTPLDVGTMDNPKFIVSNQKEESISIQRVNKGAKYIPANAD